jgi:hypothetical protein
MADHELHISTKLKKLLPPLTAEEKKQLEANIVQDGRVIDPILWWYDGKKRHVIDGMHRLPIARKHNLPYPDDRIDGLDSIEDVEIWILDHALGQRNLMAPAAVRKTRGQLYNRLKGKQGGDHKSQESKCQNDTLIGGAAAEVSRKAGVSEATVKRDGKRVEALEKCSEVIQKAVEKGPAKYSDADLNALAKMPTGDQATVATAIRKGRAKSVKEAMKLDGIKVPAAKPSKRKPPKRLDRKAYYRQWEQAIGPLLRLIDKIATGVDEKHGASHDTVHDHLNAATDAMAEWMGVKVK